MSKNGYIFGALLVLVFSFNAADAILKCWRCSTDVSNGEFCNDPFDPESISEQQRYWSYVNCSYSVGVKSVNTRPVCKKLVQEVYGKQVISRSCFYEDIDEPADRCSRDTTSSYVRTLYCRTCTTDGCNGSSGIVPIVALVLAPIALIKLILI
ncbi:uncharacterized protein LOC129952157 [Eupeodes corollae]|uniref:uncharacterized protein LOC129952157 n=1 Tax=Eupeodes corollae TaxID=290404 RepID=UPI0024912FDB|nr:uncharacterized protein LOC129952157 [Eupeodes corollae]